MSLTYLGQCLCGACRYEVSAQPEFAIRCYCRDCQQVSGGGHLPQVAFARAALSFNGPVREFKKLSDAGNALVFSFCGDCGTPLFKRTSKMPDRVFVTAGSLSNPPALDIDQKVFEDSRADWDRD